MASGGPAVADAVADAAGAKRAEDGLAGSIADELGPASPPEGLERAAISTAAVRTSNCR